VSQKHPKKGQPTNLRKARRRQEKALLWLVLFVLVVIGAALIGLIWGQNSAFLGGICLVSGGSLIAGLWLLLSLIEKWLDD
jgi:hypothetical protein